MAVVKADGYGHDAEVVAKYAIKGGASQLGVATLNEALSFVLLELKNQYLSLEISIRKGILSYVLKMILCQLLVV